MDRPTVLWWHRSFNLYLLYLGSTTGAIPWGLAYGILIINGVDHWGFAFVAVIGGFVTARSLWGFLEKRLLYHQRVHQLTEEIADWIITTQPMETAESRPVVSPLVYGEMVRLNVSPETEEQAEQFIVYSPEADSERAQNAGSVSYAQLYTA